MVYLLVGTTVVATGHHVEHTVVFTVLERGIDTHVVTVGLHALTDLILIEGGHLCQLRYRRVTLMLLLELIDFVIDLVQ